MTGIRYIRDIIFYIINNMCISLRYSKESKKIKKKKNNAQYICYQCDTIIGGDCDLYFGFDMVYCSIECREKYIIKNFNQL